MVHVGKYVSAIWILFGVVNSKGIPPPTNALDSGFRIIFIAFFWGGDQMGPILGGSNLMQICGNFEGFPRKKRALFGLAI